MPETTQPSPQEPANNSSLPRLRHELRSWTRDLAVALGLALVIIIFLYQPVKVEGTSMAPLLSDQERIFINKFVYRFEPIELRGGRLYVNGKEQKEIYIPPSFLDGSSYGPISIPSENYFVMGDHRDSSNDSRVFGPVGRPYIYGKAVFAYWPVDHFGSLTMSSTVNAASR